VANERDIGARNYSSKTVAGVLGITVQRLGQLHDDGFIPRPKRGRYPLAPAVQGYVRFLKERSAPKDSEHSRLARAQAVKVETENLRRLGELLPADMVHETLQVIAAAIVSQRPGQAGRLANELASINDPGIVREKILDDWRLILSDIERVFKARAAALETTDDGGDDTDAAPEADAGSVGGRKPDVPDGERGAGAVSVAPHAVLHTDPAGSGGSALSAAGGGDGNADG
jgi:hypothetical protein